MTDVNSAGMTNPTGGMVFFFIVTTIYTILSYNLNSKPPKEGQGTTSLMYYGIYLGMVFIGEFFVNLSLTAGACGKPQYSTALITTILPWGFMFGIIALLISIFPGWLSPFSNTFGYGIALMAGLSDTMNSIIKPKDSIPEDAFMAQALEHIYSDNSLLVNEITPNNFNSFWTNMKGIFTDNADQYKNKLYSLVQLKYAVAEYVWYILAGLLVTSVSYNYVINAACGINAAEMKKRHDKYQELVDAEHEEKQQPKRIYTSHD